MNFRRNEETVVFEGKVHHKSAKSYLVEIDNGGLDYQYFVPFSQIKSMSEPDYDGNIEFIVTHWWWNVKKSLAEMDAENAAQA